MSDIVNKIKKIPGLGAIAGCSETQVKEAEKLLNMKLPVEFIEYVREFGCIDFGSVEWTGLNTEGRLNTAYATEQEKIVNPNFPEGFFVLENIGIDAQLVIVNESGEVFLIQYDNMKKIADSISEYLDYCITQDKK